MRHVLQALLEIMGGAGEDAAAVASGVRTLVTNVQKLVTAAEAASEAAVDARLAVLRQRHQGTVVEEEGMEEDVDEVLRDDEEQPPDGAPIDEIADFFMERSRKKQVRLDFRAHLSVSLRAVRIFRGFESGCECIYSVCMHVLRLGWAVLTFRQLLTAVLCCSTLQSYLGIKSFTSTIYSTPYIVRRLCI